MKVQRKRLGWALVAGIGTAVAGRALYRRARRMNLRGKVVLIRAAHAG